MDEEREPDEQVANKYANSRRAPAPRTCAPPRTSLPRRAVGEADRERDWLLRTTGIFI